MIARHRALAAASEEWARSRAEYDRAATSPGYTGIEAAAARERHEHAIVELAQAVERLHDAELPAVAHGTHGAARQVTRLESEIVLAAISWFYTLGNGPADAVNAVLLQERVRELLDVLAKLAAVSA
jgi:hypothetical protein